VVDFGVGLASYAGMARLARSQQLAPHTWKGHNKERIFRLEKHRAAYMAASPKLPASTRPGK